MRRNHMRASQGKKAALEKKEDLLWKRLLKVILGVSLFIIFISAREDWFRKIEAKTVDTLQGLKAPREVSNVFIVYIDEDDYKSIFKEKSPLDSEEVQKIIKAIALGMPRVIGVDLDTSSSEFQKIQLPEWPPIVWARGGVIREGKIELSDVLGIKKPEPPLASGVAALKPDSDKVIRRYQRMWDTTTKGLFPSFPWAVVTEFQEVQGTQAKEVKPSKDELFINFAGYLGRFHNLTASQVLELSQGKGWQSQEGSLHSPLNDKIVLLGVSYDAARDKYDTPLGRMTGVELMAQIIDTELRGGVIPSAKKSVMVLLVIFDSIALLILFHSLPLGRALLVSPIVIFVVGLICFFIFPSSGFWVNIPVLVTILIYQLYDRAQGYRKALTQQLYGHITKYQSELIHRLYDYTKKYPKIRKKLEKRSGNHKESDELEGHSPKEPVKEISENRSEDHP